VVRGRGGARLSVERLVRPERLQALRQEEGSILSDLPVDDAPRSRRFEGLYGRIYNKVIQTPALRRLVFSIWGGTEPLQDLDAFVRDATAAAGTSDDPVIVDVPSGGGTLLAFLADLGYTGTVVEVDVAAAMLRRAVQAERRLGPVGFGVHFLRSDALDLPLADAVAEVVVSINGVHVVADHGRFLAELARVTKPGGALWLVTPVDGPSLRSRLILRAARRLGITPVRPPTLERLRDLLESAGFADLHWHGGHSIAGFSCAKR
jgi:ubiquinone/menaquinone biosynthesis C-methylase UbiE